MSYHDDDCMKRIIKAYLHFKGEATSAMILSHIADVGYGLKKPYSASSLSSKINQWRQYGSSGKWFNVEPVNKNGKRYWRLTK